MENQFRFYNTLTRKIETVIPHEDGKIKMYTCGPTVYHFAHIGNLRTYIMEDILVRGLSYVGYDVKRVMNITDVGHLSSDADTGEDKMLKGAKREHKTVMEVAKFYSVYFHLPPHRHARRPAAFPFRLRKKIQNNPPVCWYQNKHFHRPDKHIPF